MSLAGIVECGELLVSGWSAATGGTVSNTSEGGGFTFTPAQDFVGTARFTYTLAYRDDEGQIISVDNAFVSIEVKDDDDCEGDDCDETEHEGSYDPNDILGPDGFGDERWVSKSQTLGYTIRFENDRDLATAPAQQVTITQQLDDDLDFRRFRLGEIAFGLLELEDFFFDGVACDEAIGEDLAGLADTVSTVDGLCFDGGVPPWVEEENVFCGGEVETAAACLQRKKEGLGIFALLEIADDLVTVFGLTGEVTEGTITLFQFVADDVEQPNGAAAVVAYGVVWGVAPNKACRSSLSQSSSTSSSSSSAGDEITQGSLRGTIPGALYEPVPRLR